MFLGNQLNEDGVQLKWVAPTSLYWDVGIESGRGRQFPAGPAGGRNKNGVSSGNVFTHIGGDFGTGTAWQTGLSYLSTSPQDRTFDDLDSTGTGTIVTNSFSGTSRLWVLDGILKWAPNYNPTYTNFKLQGEFFRRKENGNLTYDTTAASLGTQTGGFTSAQSGFYLQGVYQFVPMWRVGYRYDRLNAGTARLERAHCRRFPDSSPLQPDQAHGDGRLESERVQSDPPAGRERQIAQRRDRPSGLSPVHREPGCARRPQILR